MNSDLPPVWKQKQHCFRVNEEVIEDRFNLLNEVIFDSRLSMPQLEVVPRCRGYWGMAYGYYFKPSPAHESYCRLRMMDKWYCEQWMLMILAHEMVHILQWDVIGEDRLNAGKDRLMSHGGSFFHDPHRSKMREFGLPLKRKYNQHRWFKTQNLFNA